MLKYAVLRGRDLLRYEHEAGVHELPPGARRLPVVVAEKPPHDPSTQYLDSYWQLSDDGSCVGILYIVHDKPPEVVAPAAAPIVVERVERVIEQHINEQVDALRQALLDMAAAQRVGELIFTVQHASDDAAAVAIAQLEPLAKARGLAVDDFVADWIRNRDELTSRALDALKGAA